MCLNLCTKNIKLSIIFMLVHWLKLLLWPEGVWWNWKTKATDVIWWWHNLD